MLLFRRYNVAWNRNLLVSKAYVSVSYQLARLLYCLSHSFAEDNSLKSAFQKVFYIQVQHVIKNCRLLKYPELLQFSHKLIFHFLSLFSGSADERARYSSEV